MRHGPRTPGGPSGEPPPRGRRPIERALALVWLILVLFLTLIAGYSLAATIVHSRYDSEENRSPIGRIAITAVAFAASLATLAATRRAQHPKRDSRPHQSRWSISFGLTALTLTLMLFSEIFISITGLGVS